MSITEKNIFQKLYLSLIFIFLFANHSISQELNQQVGLKIDKTQNGKIKTENESLIHLENKPWRRYFKDPKGVLTLIIENDKFVGNDRGYTNGVRISYSAPEINTAPIIKKIAGHLPMLNKEGNKRIMIAAGQNIYTPADLTAKAPISDDYPYSGWLYGSVGMFSDSGSILDSATLTLGVVGPSSLSDSTQKIVHEAINTTRPEGWDNQLKDELGAVLSFERKWRNIYEIQPLNLDFDIIPHAGANLGNVHTNALTGAIFRIGKDLPSDYGPARISPNMPGSDYFVPNRNFSWYLFSAFDARIVARNIFLDGNTFSESQSVDKNRFVNSAQFGFALTYDDTRISYTHIFMSKEFKSQKEAPQFGGITISRRF